MKNYITNILRKEIHNNVKKIFLCIGTTNCIGDSLGPRVGEILSKKIEDDNIYILGNLMQNINYNNIFFILDKIYHEIENPYFIVIDSALSNKKYIGNVIVNKKSMLIGDSLNKKDYTIGNLSIKGIVGENRYNCIGNFNILNEISEELIEQMSNDISKQIINAL